MAKLCAVVATTLILACGLLAAQTTRGPATLDDLLSEIRGLRADIARSSNATVRTQMLVARMQVQEQRINTVLRQITEVQNQIATTRQIVVSIEGSIKQAIGDPAQAPPQERQKIQAELAHFKEQFGPQLAELQQRLQGLALRESELMGQFSTEQIRWTDFNDRLDALERSLQSQ